MIEPRIWTRYAAIGDSFTEGMSDPDPARENHYLGWADRLAAHLSEAAVAAGESFNYANLAIRGRKLDDVIGRQLDLALSLRPDLISIVGGGNDILRPRVDLNETADRLEAAVVRARATGADVLLATPVDPAEAGVLSVLRPRQAIHSANVFGIAQRHRCAVVDLWTMRSLRDWRMWAEDRIHLCAEGHRRVALAALDALGYETDRGDWPVPLPPRAAVRKTDQLREHAAWVGTHLSPWVHRRLTGRSSGDTVEAKRPTMTPFGPDDLPRGIDEPAPAPRTIDDAPVDSLRPDRSPA